MVSSSAHEVRNTVREHYGKVAETNGAVGCAPGCCSPTTNTHTSAALGYSSDELASVPDGADLGLGCGNPQAIAALRAGETVLDLGSGAGFDCFLAARQVGPTGRAIGVDMTPQMVAKARETEVAEYLVALVGRLPPPYREALERAELEGLTQQATADALGISLSGAKSRIQRGREKLRALLDECCRIGVDARGQVIDCEPRRPDCRCKSE